MDVSKTPNEARALTSVTHKMNSFDCELRQTLTSMQPFITLFLWVDRNCVGFSRMFRWSGTGSPSAQEPTPWCGALQSPSSAWEAWSGPSLSEPLSQNLAGKNIGSKQYGAVNGFMYDDS